jgi:hypothetical protein
MAEQNPVACARALILDATERESAPVPMSLAGFPKEVDGHPVEYRRKEICRAGRVVQDVEGNPFPITRERLDKWVKNFDRLQTAGHKVFIPTRHTEIESKDNRGYVVAMSREGDGLFAVEQLIGEDAVRDAARNDQSVYIKRDFRDDQGNHFDEFIQHVALTPAPQVSGLGGYAKVAASRGPDTEALILKAASTEGSPAMDPILKTLRERLGAADGVPDEKLTELLDQQLATAKAAGRAEAETATAAAMSRLSDERDTAVAASRLPDAGVLKDRAALKRDRINLAVERGDMPSVVANRLKEKLVASDKPCAIALSRLNDQDEDMIDVVLGAFAGTKLGPQIIGEKTGSQAPVALARPDPDGKNAQTPEQVEAEVKKHLAQTDLGRRALAAQSAK